jgi:hypothetical protein
MQTTAIHFIAPPNTQRLIVAVDNVWSAAELLEG